MNKRSFTNKTSFSQNMADKSYNTKTKIQKWNTMLFSLKTQYRRNCGLMQIFYADILNQDICTGDHNGRAVQGMNFLRSLERWDRGFESHSRRRCLFVFILCLF
jgi:hypothetical protein